MTYVHDMTVRHIYDTPSVWLEQCLAAIALDPDTAGDDANQPIGIAIRPALPETHTLTCGDCHQPWRPIKPDDPDDPIWYGRCATCNSPNLIVDTEPLPGPSPIVEWHLCCQICEATWVGIPGDPCWWCQQAAQRQIDWQIDLLLTPPDVHPNDVTHDNRIRGWLKRMKVGVDAGLITKQQAETAFRRTQRRVA